MPSDAGRPARRPDGLPVATPLQSLTRTHALMAAGDAVMAVALADSMFIGVPTGEARGRVVLFLLLSMAPFAVVGPMIGPRIDRIKGGQRMVIMIAALLRAATMVGMAFNYDNFALFPLAFAALVLSKTYAISKSALVPLVVEDESRLVDANSVLGKTAGIVGFVAAAPAFVLRFLGTSVTLFVAAGVFVAAFAAARGLPPDRRTANGGPDSLEWQEMHTPRVLRSAALMKVLRAAAGFVFFHLAFWLNDQDAGKIWFGLCVSVGALCILAANSVAPLLRQRVNVDLMLAGTVVAVALAGLWAGWRGSILSGIVLTGVVNAAGAFGRLAFEATVQRDAPDANRARVLARFETHNQLVWAFAGVVPVLLSLSGQVGFSAVGLIGAAGCILFVTMSPGRFSRD
jgi:hypothetical protein